MIFFVNRSDRTRTTKDPHSSMQVVNVKEVEICVLKEFYIAQPSVFLQIVNGRIGFLVLSSRSFSGKLPLIFGRRVLF